MVDISRVAVIYMLLCFCANTLIIGQDSVTSFPLTGKEIKTVTNRHFGNLVTSNSSSGVLGNFASIDPAGSSFKFQGTAAIGAGDTTNRNPKVSFLSFSAKGDLFGQSFGAIFSNSSLNSGISLSANYHILIKKPRLTISLHDAVNYNMLKLAADRRFTRLKDQLMADSSIVIEQKLKLVRKDSSLTSKALIKAKSLRDNLTNQLNSSNDSIAKLLIDSINNNDETLAGLEKKFTVILLKMDSLELAVTEFSSLSSFVELKAETAKNVINDSLLMAFPLIKQAFSWITLTGGGGKQSYSTYDANAAFDKQINKKDFNTYNFGVSFNYFKKNILSNVIQYYNVGVSRQRTNNMELLSTRSITDTRKLVNGAGDVTRVVEKKYNVYSDPIIEDEGWKFFMNSYFLFGKKPSGIHFFPEINFQDNKTTIINAGLGYIISFVNSKKDQPVINTEVIFNFLDISDQGGSSIDGVLNRNQIGVSFTLPLNLLNK